MDVSSRKDINDGIATDPRRGAKGRSRAIWRNHLDIVPNRQPKFTGQLGPDGNALVEIGQITQGCFAIGYTGDRHEVFRRDAKYLDTGVTVPVVAHHLLAHNWRGAGHALDRHDRGSKRIAVGDIAVKVPEFILLQRLIHGQMRICAKDRIHEIRTKPGPHGKRRNQRKNRQCDAHQTDPRHHRNTRFGTGCTQIAPRDHKLEPGKRRCAVAHFMPLLVAGKVGKPRQMVNSYQGVSSAIHSRPPTPSR